MGSCFISCTDASSTRGRGRVNKARTTRRVRLCYTTKGIINDQHRRGRSVKAGLFPAFQLFHCWHQDYERQEASELEGGQRRWSLVTQMTGLRTWNGEGSSTKKTGETKVDTKQERKNGGGPVRSVSFQSSKKKNTPRTLIIRTEASLRGPWCNHATS